VEEGATGVADLPLLAGGIELNAGGPAHGEPADGALLHTHPSREQCLAWEHRHFNQ